jgi:acarbose 7IV-phosphotransferase
VFVSPRVFIAGPVSENLLIAVDRLPDPVPHMVVARRHWQTIGGTSAGKALNLAALGAEVALHTVVGADEAGARVLDVLRDHGVHLFADTDGGRTERHVNLMDAGGGRLSIYLDVPDPPSAPPGGAALAALAAADVAVIDLAEYARPWLAAALEVGVPIVVDLHDYDGLGLWHAPWRDAGSMAFCNDDKLPDPEPFLRALVERGAEVAVATRCARGAIGVDRSGSVEIQAVPVETVVDTNGAGDAFVAGFLVSRLAGADLRASLEAGAAQAARCLSSPGLAPGIPDPGIP